MTTSTHTFVAEGLASHNSYPKGYLSRVLSMFPDARRILHLFSGSLTKEQVGDAHLAARGVPNGSMVHGGVASPFGVLQIRFDNGLHPASRAANPDVVGNAETLSRRLAEVGGVGDRRCWAPFDLILADPPYRLADQRRYWRESMHALGPCDVCKRSGVDHTVVTYKKSDRSGGIFGFNVHEKNAPWGSNHEYAGNGYVRFKPLQKKLVVTECAKVLAPGGVLVWLDETFPMFAKRDFRLCGTISWVRSTNHRIRMAFLFERA